MRPIGNLPDEQQAQLFSEFLVAHGVRNQTERDAPDSWSVWIVDEDQVAAAQSWLKQFRADPKAKEFQAGAAKAGDVRAAEAKDLAAYHRRVRTAKSLFPQMGGYGVGVLTFGLILICVLVAIFSKLGGDVNFLRHLLISDPENATNTFLPEVFAGEAWRLFTPMFLHFGVIHLLFNMLWLFQLGSMIEARRSPWLLAVLVLVIAIGSNLAQYFINGPVFGGMSGVVYGLAGYIWIRGKYNRASGLFLDSRSVTTLLVWLVLCYTGWMGPIANTAHLAGLLIGMAWGRLSAFFASRKPE